MPLLVGEVDGLFLDQLEHLVVVRLASVEGWEAHDHFVSQDSQRPPIDREGVTAFDQYFWRQVVGRATERVSLLVALEYLGQAEVSQAHVPIIIHDDVLWFQVSVDDVF